MRTRLLPVLLLLITAGCGRDAWDVPGAAGAPAPGAGAGWQATVPWGAQGLPKSFDGVLARAIAAAAQAPVKDQALFYARASRVDPQGGWAPATAREAFTAVFEGPTGQVTVTATMKGMAVVAGPPPARASALPGSPKPSAKPTPDALTGLLGAAKAIAAARANQLPAATRYDVDLGVNGTLRYAVAEPADREPGEPYRPRLAYQVEVDARSGRFIRKTGGEPVRGG